MTITENILFHTGVTDLSIVITIKYRYMAERADLECSGQKGGQDMFLLIRIYKILIAIEISEAVDDTVAGRVYLWIDV